MTSEFISTTLNDIGSDPTVAYREDMIRKLVIQHTLINVKKLVPPELDPQESYDPQFIQGYHACRNEFLTELGQIIDDVC